LALPKGAQISFAEVGAWKFPVGTVLVKHFELPSEGERPLRLETRVLVHERYGWNGYVYRWNAEQTEAHLISGAQTDTFTVRRDGRSHRQKWYFPSGTDCLRCHTRGYGPVLGVRTEQLDRDLLRRWSDSGLFAGELGDIGDLPAFPALPDESAPLEARARAYLEANCAICHHRGSQTPDDMELLAGIALDQAKLVGFRSQDPITDASERRVVAGAPERSAVVLRMKKRGPNQMPPLASNVPDARALALIERWITGMRHVGQ
jgi:hypothetical protein